MFRLRGLLSMIHPEKLTIIPMRVIEFFGFVLNSMLMIVQLTDKKADKILQFCLYFSPEGKAFTIREVASLNVNLELPGYRIRLPSLL